MKRNRRIVLCLVLAVALSLCACKKTTTSAPTTGAAPTAAVTTQATTPSETTTQATATQPTTPAPTTTPMATVPVDTSPLIPQDRIEGSYEQWLAAMAVVGSYMQYPDIQLQGIYACSQTTMDQRLNSKGVVIHGVSGGRELWLSFLPLEQERTLSGSRDLQAMGMGFSTFDEVQPVDISAAVELTLDSLQDYIALTVLPTICYHS